jgi:hypothetical protein
LRSQSPANCILARRGALHGRYEVLGVALTHTAPAALRTEGPPHEIVQENLRGGDARVRRRHVRCSGSRRAPLPLDQAPTAWINRVHVVSEDTAARVQASLREDLALARDAGGKAALPW